MEITKTNKKDWLIVAVSGRLDANSAPEMEQEGLAAIYDNKQVALDFTDLRYISSAGLRVLLILAKKIKSLNAQLAICGIGGMVQEVVEESGIDAFFTIYESTDSLS